MTVRESEHCEHANEVWDREVDLVVVGYGAAGAVAAGEAAAAGDEAAVLARYAILADVAKLRLLAHDATSRTLASDAVRV